MTRDPEIGGELAVGELVENTVVLVGRDDRKHLMTVWVDLIGQDFVEFRAGVTNAYLVVKRNADGTLQDDTGKRIRTYRYLGTV